jgi:hypothetical protein
MQGAFSTALTQITEDSTARGERWPRLICMLFNLASGTATTRKIVD